MNEKDMVKTLIADLDMNLSIPAYECDGHGKDHISRVLKIALHLQRIEGGDVCVVAVAAYLHDIHRWIAKSGDYVAPRESISIAKQHIVNLNLDDKQVNEVLYAIEHHDDVIRDIETCKKNHIETSIIQDADKLDAIGAIGIGRAFMYGASHGIPCYLPDIPLYRKENVENENDISVLHHIYNRLINLHEQLITDEAKRIAEKRIEFLNAFFTCYMEEWYSEENVI